MKVSNGQTIFDVLISGNGNINNLFPFLEENNLNVDDTIQSGQDVLIPVSENAKESFIITSGIVQENTNYALSQQNLFDLTTQYYGNLSLLFDFMADNRIDFDTVLQSGYKIILHNAKKGNSKIKKFVILNNLIFCNLYYAPVPQYLLNEDGSTLTDEFGNPLFSEN